MAQDLRVFQQLRFQLLHIPSAQISVDLAQNLETLDGVAQLGLEGSRPHLSRHVALPVLVRDHILDGIYRDLLGKKVGFW